MKWSRKKKEAISRLKEKSKEAKEGECSIFRNEKSETQNERARNTKSPFVLSLQNSSGH